VIAEIRGLYLYFIKYTIEELRILKSLLSWQSEEDKEAEDTLLFIEERDGKSQISTYWGFYNLLRETIALEVVNPPQIFNKSALSISSNLLDGITLYDFQCYAIRQGQVMGSGTYEIPTSGGKTEVMVGLLKTIEFNKAIIIVPTVPLCDQFIKRAIKRGLDPSWFGKISGGHEKTFKHKVTIFVVNSLYNCIKAPDEKFLSFLDEVDMMLFDECHHIRAVSYNSVFRLINCRHTFFFTGTLSKEEDPLSNYGDATVLGLGGPPIFKIPMTYLQEIGLAATPYMFRVGIGGMGKFSNIPFNIVYKKHIVKNAERNDKIIKYALKAIFLGFPVLIQVQRHEHAEILLKRFKRPDIIGVYGGESGVKFEENALTFVNVDYEVLLSNISSGSIKCVIATQVFDEGVDIPDFGMIINGGGGLSRIRVLQRLGRGVRKKATINRVYMIDFIDNGHGFLRNHSNKRKIMYEEGGVRFLLNENELNEMMLAHSMQLGFTQI
jgi:superfamily II DNA or RNA helicase